MGMPTALAVTIIDPFRPLVLEERAARVGRYVWSGIPVSAAHHGNGRVAET